MNSSQSINKEGGEERRLSEGGRGEERKRERGERGEREGLHASSTYTITEHDAEEEDLVLVGYLNGEAVAAVKEDEDGLRLEEVQCHSFSYHLDSFDCCVLLLVEKRTKRGRERGW